MGFEQYKGSIADIIEKEKNGNIKKIKYVIPFLESDDPFKFGMAKFIYKK